MSAKRKSTQLHKQLITEVGKCELCGSTRNLEVHHIIPMVCEIDGIDLDVDDNKIVVCQKCHALLTPRRLLIQYGANKVKKRGGVLEVTNIDNPRKQKIKQEILSKSETFNGRMSDPDLIDELGICSGLYYQYKKELKESLNFPNLHSKYAIRLYKIFCECLNKHQNSFEVTFDYLRQAIGADAYQELKFSNFERNILSRSISSINNNTQMSITYNKIFAKNKVIGIRFHINKEDY